MITLENYINESIDLSKAKERLKTIYNKVLDKLHIKHKNISKLPTLFVSNGNCWGYTPGTTIKCNIKDVNNLIDKCNKFVVDNYKDIISNDYEVKIGDEWLIDSHIYEFNNTSTEKVAEAYAKISDYFVEEAKSLPTETSEYERKRILHNNWDRKHECCDSHTLELKIIDEQGKFKCYLYPGIELNTQTSIIN